MVTAGATKPASGIAPRRADAQRNYSRLVDAARAALTERGGDVPLEEIARRAGVGIGTLYRHFPTRLDLLETVYREDVDKLESSAKALIGSHSEWDALAEWLSGFIAYAATKRVLFHELVEALGRDSELLSHSREVIFASAHTMLLRAQEAGVARTDIESSDLLRLVGGCTMMPNLEFAQQERMLRIVLDGIRV